MKRFITIALVLCMVFPNAVAEEEKPGSIWNSIGSWFDQAWEDTSGWVSQAWSGASKWVEGAWGDASGWVEQTWNESSRWVTDIWGDASTWAVGTYESAAGSVGAWWADTFNKVTGSEENPWAWLAEKTASLTPGMREALGEIKEAAAANDRDAETKVRSVFDSMLKKLSLNEEDAQKVWNTVMAYADQKGIARLTAAKLALPYLFQLAADSAETSGNIPAVAIAQYLTAIIEKLNVHSDDSANDLIIQLNETLNGMG